MNDLYNVQDVILLCEVIEISFEITYQKYFYNCTPNIVFRGRNIVKMH